MKFTAQFKIPRAELLDFEFSLNASGITAIFGKSGCGKTSLLRAIAGLEKHSNCFLKVGDETWQDENTFIPVHERSIGFVFQEASLFEHLSVKANLEYGMKRIPANSRKISLNETLSLLNLGPLLKRKTTDLSGGERQRVAIARALLVSPKLLLMDEPLASLDQERKEELLPYIETLSKKFDIPVLYVSHSTSEISRLANQLILIENSFIKAAGPINELLTRTDLSLAHRTQAESIVYAKTADYDSAFHLNQLKSDVGTFLVPGEQLDKNKDVRLRLLANDISITLKAQNDTSILNIFPAIIDEIRDENGAQATLRLLINGTPILARITLKSSDNLSLKKGKQVFAQIKSVAVLA